MYINKKNKRLSGGRREEQFMHANRLKNIIVIIQTNKEYVSEDNVYSKSEHTSEKALRDWSIFSNKASTNIVQKVFKKTNRTQNMKATFSAVFSSPAHWIYVDVAWKWLEVYREVKEHDVMLKDMVLSTS